MKAATPSASQMALPSICWRWVIIFIGFYHIIMRHPFQVASTRGISMERLVNFLRQFVIPMVGGMENYSSSLMEAASQEVNICDKDVAAVVVKLSKVKVQAARFRAR